MHISSGPYNFLYLHYCFKPGTSPPLHRRQPFFAAPTNTSLEKFDEFVDFMEPREPKEYDELYAGRRGEAPQILSACGRSKKKLAKSLIPKPRTYVGHAMR